MRVPCPRTKLDNEDPNYCEGGEHTINILEDCEGDAGVINGLHYFMTAEIVDSTCECILSIPEVDALILESVANAKYGDTAP